jgi:hypothetical protein
MEAKFFVPAVDQSDMLRYDWKVEERDESKLKLRFEPNDIIPYIVII